MFYSVVETEQELGNAKVIVDEHLFSNRKDALTFLHSRFIDIRLVESEGAGVKDDSFSWDGWFWVENEDGDLREGQVSEGIEPDQPFRFDDDDVPPEDA